ncbi:hypothetical protein JY96_06850 [Aquabacterium sp. NJ1]|nr:hypothetical protein JY96_06850 [Aquabacterium sp. NJ1]
MPSFALKCSGGLADVSGMPDRHPLHPGHTSTHATTHAPSGNRKTAQPDDTQWRAAAEEGARLAAKQWQVPLDHITEIALSDAEGPCYLFKVLYTDRHGQRRTAAVRMPKQVTYTSPLSMASMLGARQACHTP